MVGYPNVGKSSAVKRCGEEENRRQRDARQNETLQTLELAALVVSGLPRPGVPLVHVESRGLVCNGVLPIDRLTDTSARRRRRVADPDSADACTDRLPLPDAEDQNRNATAGGYARTRRRGLTVPRGRPDGSEQAEPCSGLHQRQAAVLRRAGGVRRAHGVAGDAIVASDGENEEEEATATADAASVSPSARTGTLRRAPPDAAEAPRRGFVPDDPLAKQLLAEMMDELGIEQKAERRRAEHKFQKKSKVKGGSRTRVRRGPQRGWR